MVKASITGSVIGDLLFVLGLAMTVGGWNRGHQSFNKTAVWRRPRAFLATIALVMRRNCRPAAPATLGATLEYMNVLVSVVLIGVYGASLFFSLHTHKHLFAEETAKFEAA